MANFQSELLIVDSAEKPPIFENARNPSKKCQAKDAPRLFIRNVFGEGGHFWWCFEVLLFEHEGFFSRIDCMKLTPMTGKSMRDCGQLLGCE
jgi:hypothetical protein